MHKKNTANFSLSQQTFHRHYKLFVVGDTKTFLLICFLKETLKGLRRFEVCGTLEVWSAHQTFRRCTKLFVVEVRNTKTFLHPGKLFFGYLIWRNAQRSATLWGLWDACGLIVPYVAFQHYQHLLILRDVVLQYDWNLSCCRNDIIKSFEKCRVVDMSSKNIISTSRDADML